MQNPQEVQSVAAELARRMAAGRRSLATTSAKETPVGVILGTGLSGLAEKMNDPIAVPYAELPGFPASSVASHAGAFVCGRFPARCGEDDGQGRTALIQQGRCHLYEGRNPAEVCMGVRVMAAMGVRTLIVGGVIKNCTDLFVAVLPRLGGKEGVFVPGLALTCESLPQVFLGLAASQFHRDTSSLNKNQS